MKTVAAKNIDRELPVVANNLGFHACGLLRWAQLEQSRSLIEVGQIAMSSSSKAARTRRFAVSSAPSS
jgi:hypothetical protein